MALWCFSLHLNIDILVEFRVRNCEQVYSKPNDDFVMIGEIMGTQEIKIRDAQLLNNWWQFLIGSFLM